MLYSKHIISFFQKLNSSTQDSFSHHQIRPQVSPTTTDPPKPYLSEQMAKTIGTHNGAFHCDEVMACFLLKQTQQFKTANIVRTRDKKILDTLDIVVDVGDIYNPEMNRFDHHQKSFNHTFGHPYNSIKLSSAGLIWKHYGKVVLKTITGIEDQTILHLLYLRMYRDLFQALDAIDNGIPQFKGKQPEQYREWTNLASRVGRLNPPWNNPDVNTDQRFHQAVEIVGEEFRSILNYLIEEWLPARDVVVESVQKRFDTHASGRILSLRLRCPWIDHLFSIQEEFGTQPILYCLYQNTNGQWMIQCVPQQGQHFTNRLSMPEDWRGKRDEELAAITGIEGIIFCHATGFIGGASTYEGVLEMAVKSMEAQNS